MNETHAVMLIGAIFTLLAYWIGLLIGRIRHLTIGYKRAARLIEQMEQDGYLTPMNTSGTRALTARFPRAA
jgi:mannose/fructose/N-acetylgalactosamine-specific phosphotransferase system component IID